MEHSLDNLPTFEQLARFAPVALVSVGLIYFGWWLRGDSIKHLRDWIDELKRDK